MMFAGFLHRVSLLVLLGKFQGPTGWSSRFNPDPYKPQQWGSVGNFDNAPGILCPTEDLHRCICKNDVQKSRFLVDSEDVSLDIGYRHRTIPPTFAQQEIFFILLSMEVSGRQPT